MDIDHELHKKIGALNFVKPEELYNNSTPTINLTVSYAGNPPNQGIALLSWTFSSGSTDSYSISRSIEGGSWVVIVDNIPGTSSLYNDTIPDGYCEVVIEYRVEAIDIASGMMVISNIAEDIFSDTQQPLKPTLDSVSIVNNNQVIIGWKSSESPDVIGTIIYRLEDIWKIIDTVYSTNDTSYLHSTSNTCNDNYLYAIAALPSCGLPSPKTELTAQRPILLGEPVYDICAGEISFTWESYINSTPGLEKYEIWVSENGLPAEILDEVSGDLTSYVHSEVSFDTDYQYFIRAIFGNNSSTSCSKSITTGSYIVPSYVYLVNATVLPDNPVLISIDVDLQPISCNWDIYRSDPGGGNESIIHSFSRSEINSNYYEFHDEDANGSLGYYQYKIIVTDSCGNTALNSSTAKTIFLSGQQISETQNLLTWNHYEGWNTSVEKYYILRSTDNTYPIDIIDSVSNSLTEYTDDISGVDASKSEFQYRILAIESDGNLLGYKESSSSNTVQFFRDTEFYMPNAFRPAGTNSIFKPVTVGFGGTAYLFQIYNRWGQLLYETTDSAEGWDGKHKGIMSPQGTYVYRLVYTSVFNDTKIIQGTVTLIH